MVLWALNNALGGEILVPKIPSYLITDLAEAIILAAKTHYWYSPWREDSRRNDHCVRRTFQRSILDSLCNLAK